MYCTKCGKELVFGAKYCISCGYSVDGTSIKRSIVKSNNINYNYPKSNNVNNINKTKQLTGVQIAGMIMSLTSLALIVVGTFMPFMKVSVLWVEKDANMWQGDLRLLTTVFVILLLIPFFFIVLRLYVRSLGCIISGVGFLAYVIIEFVRFKKDEINTNEAINGYWGNSAFTISPGIGFWLIIISCILLIVAGIMMIEKQ